jgi:hypothetical protein
MMFITSGICITDVLRAPPNAPHELTVDEIGSLSGIRTNLETPRTHFAG